MGVNVHRDADSAMPKKFLHHFCRNTHTEQLTFSHTILFKDQKKSREKVEQLNGRLRARFGCRAIRATAFSSPVARPLCVPNSRQSGQWSANTAARSTGKQALLLGRPPLARPQRARSGLP